MRREMLPIFFVGGLLALSQLPPHQGGSCRSVLCTPVFAQVKSAEPGRLTIHKLFADTKKVKRTVKNVKNVEATVVLLQEHAKAVTGFINKGAEGMPERHPVPSRQ